MYGLKQASHNWYEKLNLSLLDKGFTSSNIEPCIFIKVGVILLLYVGDCIMPADSEALIDVLIHSLKNGKEKYILTEEGSIDKFLGTSISKLDDNQYYLAQPFLIELIIEFIES